MEIGNFPDKQFKVMVLKMLTNLRRMVEQRDNFKKI